MDNSIKQKHYLELIENNVFYDVTGNMSIWRIHETYEGSGNGDVPIEQILKKTSENPNKQNNK